MNWLLKPDHSEWLVKELVSRRYKSHPAAPFSQRDDAREEECEGPQ